jgi:hypothetical protein
MLAHGDARLLWWTVRNVMLTGLVEGYPLKSPYKVTDGPEDALIPHPADPIGAYSPIAAAKATPSDLRHVAWHLFGDAGERELIGQPELTIH